MKKFDINTPAKVTKRKLTNEERLNRKGIPSFKQMCSGAHVAIIRKEVKNA